MTQLNREELIEKIAQAIRVANMPINPNHELCQAHQYLAGSKILAEAVLKALGEYLPSLENENNLEKMCDESEFYTQFKNICEGK